jgi:hypothetical protein
MNKFKKRASTLLLPTALILLSCITITSHADDLNDGIAIDKLNNDNLDLSTNIQFILRKSLAKTKIKGKNNSQKNLCGSGNIVIGAGSKVKEVINISTNTGTTAVCGK